MRLALDGTLDTGSASTQVTPNARAGWRQVIPAASAAVAVTSLLAGAVTWMLWPVAETQPVTRFAYALPDGQSFSTVVQGSAVLALSRDGRQLIYNAQDGLYVRAMDELDARLVPGTEAGSGVASLVFSPTGQAVAYWDLSGQLKRIGVSGGTPDLLATVAIPPGGISWAADNTVLFDQIDGIYRVPANGGTPELVISAEPGEFLFAPQILPAGDAILFSSTRGTANDTQVEVQSFVTGERTVLIPGGQDARYLPTGHIVYARGNGLFARVFDSDSFEISEGAVPLVQGVMGGNAGQGGAANYDVSDNGTLVYVSGTASLPGRSLVWVDRAGQETPLDAPSRVYAYPRISPDETKVALDMRDAELDIWTWDFNRPTLARVTVDPGEDEYPAWSPESQRIAFSSSRDGGSAADSDLYWRSATGTGSADRIAEFAGQIFPTAFLPDGDAILVRTTAVGDALNDDIALVRLDDEEGVIPLLHSSFNERNAEISPDGNWLAYSSDFSGREEVYVRPYPDYEADLIQVSTEGGVQPLWARDGGELFYRNGDAMMAVSYDASARFTPELPRLLFEYEYLGGTTNPFFDGRSYDYSSREDKFLMIKQPERSLTPPRIIIIQNWFSELKRLAAGEE